MCLSVFTNGRLIGHIRSIVGANKAGYEAWIRKYTGKWCAESFINQDILSVYKVFSFCAKCGNGFKNEALAAHGTSSG